MPRKQQIPYRRKELFGQGPLPAYRGRQLDEIAFPPGGIGAEPVTIAATETLRVTLK